MRFFGKCLGMTNTRFLNRSRFQNPKSRNCDVPTFKNFRGDFGVFHLRPVECENADGKAEVQNTGMSLQVAGYKTELVVRVRNFVAHEWVSYEYHFSL